MKAAEAIDLLLEFFTSENYSEVVQRARSEFYEMTGGPFDQSSDDFEMKMSQFADWYLFERKHEDLQATPVSSEEASRFARDQGFESCLEALRSSRNSLFEFSKVKNDDVYIKDLLSNEKVVVPESNVTVGFQRDELFQARIIFENENYQFGSSFCFHPAPANRFLQKEVKRIRKIKDAEEREVQKQEFLMKAFRMKYKLNQYKHVDVKDIYSQDPKLRF